MHSVGHQVKVWRKATALALGLATLAGAGCATSSLQSRQQERVAAYAALQPEFKSAVDQGQIKVGMSQDAVYIAWGKPSQVLTGETAEGTLTTWIYLGSYLQGYSFWTYRLSRYGHWCFPEPYLAHDFYPRRYVRAEVVLKNGVVKEWRSLPRRSPK